MTWIGEVIAIENDVQCGESYFRVTLAGVTDARVMQVMIPRRDIARYPVLRRVRVTVEPR